MIFVQNNILPKLRCDIFCQVIDNFGDAGVCWRLAKQLAKEFGWSVHLIINDSTFLYKLNGSKKNLLNIGEGLVYILPWQDNLSADYDIDIVIETFACSLPTTYENSLAKIKYIYNKKILIFNINYISAEKWTAKLNGYYSVHPQLLLKKVFLFPGFRTKNSGLLVECDLQTCFKYVDQNRSYIWRKLGLIGNPPNFSNVLIITLFSYENPAIEVLLKHWCQIDKPIVLIIPDLLNTYIFKSKFLGNYLSMNSNNIITIGSLTILNIPFLTQNNYDKLLRLADFNFVRGEDSFVRAQLVARPFCWQIYPQDNLIHMKKLNSFLNLYTIGLNNDIANNISKLFNEWNYPIKIQNIPRIWTNIISNIKLFRKHAENWALYLTKKTHLAKQIVQFTEKLF